MAVDYFLKLDGIPGESTDDKHKDHIDIMSWTFSEQNQGKFGQARGTGGTSGKVNINDISVTSIISKASPKLFLACATGQHIKEGKIFCRKAGGKPGQQDFLQIKLTDVMISSYATGGGGEIPVDSYNLNFGKIEFEYKEQKADGSLGGPVTHHWDLMGNKGG